MVDMQSFPLIYRGFQLSMLSVFSVPPIMLKLPLTSLSLVLFVLGLSVGQLLFKKSALNIAGRGFVSSLASDPTFYLAAIIYAATALLYTWILTRIPLSAAYPFVAGGIVVVPLLGHFFFGEQLTGHFWLGASLIVIGMLVIRPVG